MDKMILVLNSSDEQKQALDAFIAALENPQSPQYHKFLTPQQFEDQFGVSENDVDQVAAWLASHGFTIDEVPTGRRTILFSGTAGMVEQAFHTEIHEYLVNGETHYANSTDPQIPEALAAVVKGTSTLHDFPRRSMLSQKTAVPEYGSGAGAYVGPADFATIYNLNSLYSATYDGTGVSIAIVGRTNINLSDVQTFRSYFGLPANNPQIIVNGTNPGITSDVDEAVLDVEWSGAVAKGATIKFVVSASTSASDGVDLSAQYIVSHNTAPVMSTSYGSCEAAMGSAELAFYSNLWQQASAEGISTMISAGDSGAAGCDGGSASTSAYGRAVNGLCSSIYSVCVGGTQFNDTANNSSYWLSSTNPTTKESAVGYIPEIVWNQSGSVSGGSGLWAGGGGVSAYYAKPSWQAGLGVPSDGKRDVPDVSLAASTHDGYLIVENNTLYLIGGTSASSPSFAGIMAIVNQKTRSAQGNPNPTLYALAALQNSQTTSHAYFHDVTAGSNTVPGATGFNAGAGYDQASGLGSVNGANLVNYWTDATVTVAPSMNLSLSTTSLTLYPSASGTSTVQVAIAGGFSHAVTLAVSGAPAGVTATLASTSFAAPGSGSSLLTIAAGPTAAAGTSTITVTANSNNQTYTATLALTVVPAFTLTTSASAAAVLEGSNGSVNLSGAFASGFPSTAAVVLTAAQTSGAALPAGVTVTPAANLSTGAPTAKLTIAATNTAAPGTYPITITGTYTVSQSVTVKSTAAFTLTVAPSSSFTLAASPASLTVAPGASGTTTLTMTPVNGFNSTVTLAAGSLPAGITASFAAASIPHTGGQVVVTLKAANTVAAGSYTIPLTGTGGGVTIASNVTLVVSGFTLSAGASATLVRSGTVAVPFSSAVSNGFSGPLTIAATGLPAGVTAVFTPPTIQNPASGSGSMKLTASALAAQGTKTITLTATSATGATQSATVSLTVH
jgi:subtilase family serine protease